MDGPQHENTADSLVDYGWNLFAQQRYEDAEYQLRDALEIYRQRGVRGSQHINALAILQQVLASSGRHDEAERVIEQAWAAMQGYDALPRKSATARVDDVIVPCAAFACYFATIGRSEQAAEFAHRAALAAERVRIQSSLPRLSRAWQSRGCDWETRSAIERHVQSWSNWHLASPMMDSN